MCTAADHMRKELEHIAAMIAQLELLGATRSKEATTAVMSPVYWRNRINAILGAANLPPSITEQAAALLRRLERMNQRPADLDSPGTPPQRARPSDYHAG